ncbi:putative MoxR protein [Geranomyces michiganensis]|nr:putative MoxR protein [Geranomyces michiganensis]
MPTWPPAPPPRSLHDILTVIQPHLYNVAASKSASGTATPRSFGHGGSINNTSAQATEELIISILIALVAGQRAMLVSIKPELSRELRRTLEQLLSYIFNFTVTHVQVDRPDRPITYSEFLSSLLHRVRGADHISVGTPASGSNASRRRGNLSLDQSEDDPTKYSLASSHFRQTSVRSDSISDSGDSPAVSAFALAYRSQRKHHTRVAATAGSRPILLSNDTPPESNHSLMAKQLPNIVIVEGMDLASGAVHAALMDVIERGQVTDRSSVYPCPTPFLVIGLVSAVNGKPTMPSQLLDRFVLCHTLSAFPQRCVVTYPAQIPLVPYEDVAQMAVVLDKVHLDPDVFYYARNLITALRNHPSVSTGVSPKCGTDLVQAARILALMSGMWAVTPDHVSMVIDKVIGHRLTAVQSATSAPQEPHNRLRGISGLDIILDVVSNMPVPV